MSASNRTLIDLSTCVARVTEHADGSKTLQIFPWKGECCVVKLTVEEQGKLAAAIAPTPEYER